jgi:lipopolysaccharide transport system ATP-binding protein
MPLPIISVENLSKRYLVGHQVERVGAFQYTALRDVIGKQLRDAVRRAAGFARGEQLVGGRVEEFWALKDVSFEVQEGEVLGIIGKNGAGKSTLLKILSRITEPTKGRVTLRGRVASLLEVGTGFHPELTGRENIYLNGAILGMSRAEIRKKFDEIVAFAEVEQFIDTPVKRYSSGMYVRLAFAVAAHLEPEILIVDEVLAVGDAEFQKKCLGKMNDVSRREGRTILFVSHNMAAMGELVTRAVVLNSGSIGLQGTPSEAIARYLARSRPDTVYVSPYSGSYNKPYIARIEVITSHPGGVHTFTEPLEVKFWIRHDTPLSRGCFSFRIMNQYQTPIVHAWALYPNIIFGGRPGESILTCRFPKIRLNVGRYSISAYLSEPPGGEHYETLDTAVSFEIVRQDRAMTMWTYHPDLCAYHEEFSWISDQVASKPSATLEQTPAA